MQCIGLWCALLKISQAWWCLHPFNTPPPQTPNIPAKIDLLSCTFCCQFTRQRAADTAAPYQKSSMVSSYPSSSPNSQFSCNKVSQQLTKNPHSMLRVAGFKSGERSGARRPLSGASGWSEQSGEAIWSLPRSDHTSWWPQDATLWQKVPNNFYSVLNGQSQTHQ